MTNNFSTQLYQKLIHPDTARALMAGFFRDDKAAAIALLQNNGVAIDSNASDKDVQIAFLKAIKDSTVFQDQAATVMTNYLTQVAGHHGMSNFVGANAGRYQYYNDVDDISSIDPNSFSQSALAGSGIFSTDTGSSGSSSTSGLSSSVLNSGIFSENTGATSSSGATAAPASSAASNSGGFWSTLGSIFTPTVLQAGVKTGLQAVSTSMTSSANATSEANALAIEQARVQQAQAQAAAAQAGGLSTGTIVGITAAVLVVVVVVVLLVRKK